MIRCVKAKCPDPPTHLSSLPPSPPGRMQFIQKCETLLALCDCFKAHSGKIEEQKKVTEVAARPLAALPLASAHLRKCKILTIASAHPL